MTLHQLKAQRRAWGFVSPVSVHASRPSVSTQSTTPFLSLSSDTRTQLPRTAVGLPSPGGAAPATATRCHCGTRDLHSPVDWLPVPRVSQQSRPPGCRRARGPDSDRSKPGTEPKPGGSPRDPTVCHPLVSGPCFEPGLSLSLE